jgi:sec-independent protein translocase protein TatA
MLGLGPTEIIVILFIVLVIFGAGKLPELGSNLGKGIKNFRKSISDAKEALPQDDKAESPAEEGKAKNSGEEA